MGNLFAFAEHLGCILLYYFLNLQLLGKGEPTTENWDNIAGNIIKRTGMKSIKEAMRAYDPTFPDGGRVRDAKGNIAGN